MKILLVDDTELFLKLERSYLERETFTISTARSGREALNILRMDSPDLVLLDLFMPEMNGDAVCREIKRNPQTRNIVVIMTSSDKENAKELCYEAGCDAFVSKPIKRDDLLATIEKHLAIAKRRWTRVPTHLHCRAEVGGRSYDAMIHTISEGGLFVQVSPEPQTGENMTVTFSLPGMEKPMIVEVVVRWAGQVREDGAWGVGAQFRDTGPEERALIKNYVDTRVRMLGTTLKGH